MPLVVSIRGPTRLHHRRHERGLSHEQFRALVICLITGRHGVTAIEDSRYMVKNNRRNSDDPANSYTSKAFWRLKRGTSSSAAALLPQTRTRSIADERPSRGRRSRSGVAAGGRHHREADGGWQSAYARCPRSGHDSSHHHLPDASRRWQGDHCAPRWWRVARSVDFCSDYSPPDFPLIPQSARAT
jgi:hypothetical protein